MLYKTQLKVISSIIITLLVHLHEHIVMYDDGHDCKCKMTQTSCRYRTVEGGSSGGFILRMVRGFGTLSRWHCVGGQPDTFQSPTSQKAWEQCTSQREQRSCLFTPLTFPNNAVMYSWQRSDLGTVTEYVTVIGLWVSGAVQLLQNLGLQ